MAIAPESARVEPTGPITLHYAGDTLAHGIGWAVENIGRGNHVRRRGWNGKGMFLGLQVPDAHSRMTQPYVWMYCVDASIVPWTCSQSDLLVTDWELA